MTQFETDLEHSMSINGGTSSKGMWNLIISKRDLGLWKRGMKPTRTWKVSDVKKYFGLKGNKDKIYDDICKMVEEYTKPKVYGRMEFIEEFFIPALTEREACEARLGIIDWEDSFLDEWAEKNGVTIDHNSERHQCDTCNLFFDEGTLAHDEDTEELECDECNYEKNSYE